MKRPKNHIERLSRDVSLAIDFCASRRGRHADVRATALRFLNHLEWDALEFLLDVIETRGRCGLRHRRFIHRLRSAMLDKEQCLALRTRLIADGCSTGDNDNA